MQQLSLEQIKSISQGAVRVREEQDGIHLYRFTQAQEQAYLERGNMDFYRKTLSTAGVKLVFQTDSQTLFLKVCTSYGSSRTYFSHEVYVDGQYVGSLNNFDGMDIPRHYSSLSLPFGEYAREFKLGEGVKTVEVYFPWSTVSVIREAAVDEGALVKPVKCLKKLLAFGDSITQGYDALRTSHSYASRFARRIDAELVNKGIGGEQFFPQLAALKEDFTPDYIIVAYGTNDWNRSDSAPFREKCAGFYRALCANYPSIPIWAITPIWRKDCEECRKFGPFSSVDAIIRESTAQYANVRCIRGFDFIEHDAKYYADGNLHPNDEGFARYAEALYEQLEEYL